MNQRPLAACAISLAGMLLLAASCEPPRSKNPLSDPAKAVADTRLTGVWGGRTGDNSKATLAFEPRDGGRVDLVLIGDDDTKGAIVLAFEALSTKIGAKNYWSLRAKSYGDDYGGTVKVSDDYIFAKYELSKSGALTISVMDEDKLAAAVKAGVLEGAAVEGKPLVLTASSDKLAAFLATADGDQSFRPLGVFKRAKVDYPKANPANGPE